ncbi:MAG: TolC family protein [Bacteroidota bacterium]
MQKYIISFLLLSMCLLLQAQSLAELQQEVEQNNPSLQALWQAYLAAQERIPQVGQLPQPELGVSAFALPVETRLGPQQLRIGASQSFPWFGTLAQQKAVAATQSQRLQAQISIQRQELYFQLDQAYLDLYQLEEERRIKAQQLDLLAAREQLALAKIEGGKGSAADVLRIQLRQEELRQQLLILEQSQAIPQAAINQLRHKSAEQEVQLSDTLSFAIIPWTKDSLVQRLERMHPRLRDHALEQQMVLQQLQLNEMQNKPSFGVGVDYIAVAERELATISDNGRDILQFRASVKVPIYRKAYQARKREQELQLQRIQQQTSATQDQFATIIEQAYTQYATARLEFDLYERQIELTQSLLSILGSSYSASGSGMDELLAYEQSLIDYQQQQLSAIVKSHRAKQQLQSLLY